jgi:endonuclease/exonuclease/phosphatase family metal-dependent hydrolase
LKDKYHSPILGRKQVGSLYKTFSSEIGKVMAYTLGLHGPTGMTPNMIKPVDQVAIDFSNPDFNNGPTGLVIFAKKTLKGKDLSNSNEIVHNLTNKGTFFSRFNQGVKLNKAIPLSRGTLNGLFEIEDVGVFDVSNIHLTTSEGNNAERMYQVSKALEDQKMRRLEPKKAAYTGIRQFLVMMCRMHPIDGCSTKEAIHAKNLTDIKQEINSLKDQWIENKVLTQNDVKEMNNYFATLNDSSFARKHLFGILGGDFNFEPYGDINEPMNKRQASAWPYQLILEDPNNSMAMHSTERFLSKASYDPTNNKLARENNTSAVTIIKDLFAKYTNYERTLPKSQTLDYIVLNSDVQEAQSRSVIAVENSKFVLTKEKPKTHSDAPQVSDHYGLVMDLMIYSN